jgi:pimeloyl-ACP methyl ester carboxylesterase
VDYSHIVEDFLQSVGVSELYMGGVSAGSYAAIESTLKGKKFRVKALILFSSVMLSITPKEIRTRTKTAKFALRLKPDKLRALIEHNITRVAFDTAPGNVQQLDIFYIRPYSYYHQLFQTIINQGDKKQATLDIPCPALLLHGMDDDLMPIDLARLSKRLFKNATFVEFKDYKHAMVFAHGPEFIPPIIRFLEASGLLPVSEPSKKSVGATHAR